jgi:regulator of protease activity HflC (stomatin/prohibitin superfamily)
MDILLSIFFSSPLFWLPIIILLLVTVIRQVQQYERGVMFTMGRYAQTKEPGWRIVIPIFQSMQKVDMRVKAVDVPSQEAITQDNVSCHVNAVIYYKVKDAAKSVIEVEDFFHAMSQLAQTTMRNVVGQTSLDHLLASRDEISDKIKLIVDEASDPWGIAVVSVEMKDVVLPQDMKRTMAKEAEAERERRAVVIKADGEVQASEKLAQAATMLGSAPGALHLRTLQSVNDISSDQSNTTIWMLPLEVLHALEGIAKKKE